MSRVANCAAECASDGSIKRIRFQFSAPDLTQDVNICPSITIAPFNSYRPFVFQN